MAKDVLVVIEHENGSPRRPSLEALALARRLAASFGGRALAAVAGHGVGDIARRVASSGADTVYHFDHELLGQYTPDGYRLVLEPLVRDLSPEWVLMGHTYLAQDLLPLVSARFDAPVVSDCVDAEVDGETVVLSRQPYDAKLVARIADRGPAPHFATLQSGAFPADELPDAHDGTVEQRPVDLSPDRLRRKVLEVRQAGGRTVDLTSAEIIVAGGRGLGSKEKFQQLIGQLAEALGGAAIGASRPVVDNDWLPHDHQIGSSGQTVSPKLYIGVGISGAIQHVVGIRGSQVIVAINKDKDAPIFNEATYGVVGDAEELVPAIAQAIAEARQS
ncbi:MAG: electron transfer flavoprotein subunit alpha/FixB family protein [Acidobacteria bacterium]|nr:MAG: electron transfer flavoprotein subunit alpha/FixB family protein [Acidobacteriota bacterium]